MKIVQKTADKKAFVESVQSCYDKGGVILDTNMLMQWTRDFRALNRGLEYSWANTNLDPEGLHVGFVAILHNDEHWRTQFYLKVKGTDEPLVALIDVSMEAWRAAREMVEHNLREMKK